MFCFVSVFAPSELKKKIYHKWQKYSQTDDAWITTDRAGYKLTGGRRGGYRGFTYKKNVENGDWRVDVITEDDLLLGRINST